MTLAREQFKRQVFMSVALQVASLGTCDRKQVGAVIVRDGRCVSWGFNGAPPGLPHCSENGHGWGYKAPKWEGHPDLYSMAPDWKERAHLSEHEMELMPWDYKGGVEYLANKRGCRNATHAEANALAFAARQGISTEGATLFVTVSTCDVCARLVIASGIDRVYYAEEYREANGCQILSQAGIHAVQLR